MAERALHLLLQRSSIQRRLELATIDTDLCSNVLTFPDIRFALIRDGDIVICNKNRQLGITKMTKAKFAVHFLKVAKITVQIQLSPSDWTCLFKMKLKKIFFSVDNLQEINFLSEKLNMDTLRSLYILQRVDQPLTNMYKLSVKNLEHFLAADLTRICLTGLILPDDTLKRIFSLPRLKSLDMIGSVVNSQGIPELHKTLSSPPCLEEISLPPSWFSFSSTYPDENYKQYSFGWLNVPKLCLYVQFYEDKIFWHQLNYYLPEKLQTLVLYGNYSLIKSSERLKSWKKFQVLFGPNDAQLLTFRNCGETRLLSHLVKKPLVGKPDNSDFKNWMLLSSTSKTEKQKKRNSERIPQIPSKGIDEEARETRTEGSRSRTRSDSHLARASQSHVERSGRITESMPALETVRDIGRSSPIVRQRPRRARRRTTLHRDHLLAASGLPNRRNFPNSQPPFRRSTPERNNSTRRSRSRRRRSRRRRAGRLRTQRGGRTTDSDSQITTSSLSVNVGTNRISAELSLPSASIQPAIVSPPQVNREVATVAGTLFGQVARQLEEIDDR